jgi:hypothetical protein
LYYWMSEYLFRSVAGNSIPAFRKHLRPAALTFAAISACFDHNTTAALAATRN